MEPATNIFCLEHVWPVNDTIYRKFTLPWSILARKLWYQHILNSIFRSLTHFSYMTLMLVKSWTLILIHLFVSYHLDIWASLVAQRLKRLPGMRETRVLSLGWEDPLEKEMATHSSILAWRIPWREEPGRLQSMGLQRVGHDWVTSLSLFLTSRRF